MAEKNAKVLALSGGVGGAKLALGLSLCLPPEELSIIANTADDFVHLGLPISPDIDTLMYTLAGINNQAQGWGLEGESWQCMDALKSLGGSTWFQLGDRDIATHLMRLEAKQAGLSLTEITRKLCSNLGVDYPVLPMSDDVVQTQVHCKDGEVLPFQSYFVEKQCQPEVNGFTFNAIDTARISDAVDNAVSDADLLIVCPSNPFVSVRPILDIPGLQSRLSTDIPVRVVVSPIVGGMAIKGPAAKMMDELNMPRTPLAVAEYYQGFATHFVLDRCDAEFHNAIEALGMQVLVTNTVMKSRDDRKQLAADILGWVQ